MINLRNIFNPTINLILLIITITLFITLIVKRDNIVFLKKIFIKIGLSLIIIFLILDYILKFYKKNIILIILYPIFKNLKQNIIIYSTTTIILGLILNIYEKKLIKKN